MLAMSLSYDETFKPLGCRKINLYHVIKERKDLSSNKKDKMA